MLTEVVRSMILWGIVFAAAVIAEIATLQLVSIWFAAGALGAFITAAMGKPFSVQAIVFVVVSAVLLCLTRPLLKLIRVKKEIPPTGDDDVGKLAVVTETIDNHADTGRVRIGGVNWRARSDGNAPIEAGTSVRVTAIEGTTAFVRKEETS